MGLFKRKPIEPYKGPMDMKDLADKNTICPTNGKLLVVSTDVLSSRFAHIHNEYALVYPIIAAAPELADWCKIGDIQFGVTCIEANAKHFKKYKKLDNLRYYFLDPKHVIAIHRETVSGVEWLEWLKTH